MKRRFKATTAVVMAATMMAPTMAFAQTSAQDKGISVNIEKKSVVFGTESGISVKFNEKLDAEKIVADFKCYDMTISSELKYNKDKDVYEGAVKFDQEPEYLNVWELEKIEVKSANPYSLDRNALKDMGLDLDSCDITQEVVVDDEEVQKAIDEGTASNMVKRTIARTSVPVDKVVGEDRYDTAIKISNKGWQKADTVIVVNEESSIAGVIATPLATTYGAPILLTRSNSTPNNIITELKRLNAKNIVVVGSEKEVASGAIKDLKKSGASVSRIGGNNVYEVSLNIAKAIDEKQDVSKVYVTNGTRGQIDALTIAAKAGEEKRPIILTEKSSINSSVYSWLKSESLSDAYVIGGDEVVSNEVLNKIDGVVKADVSKNRVYGTDRHETNAAVISKFYHDKNLRALFVAKSDELIDALACGPFAAKKQSPILINPTNYVSARHTENLNTYKAEKVYQVGGGITSKVMTSIANSVSKHNSNTNTNSSNNTVVLDAGHGGSDSGAVSGSRREKDYTLDTTLATSAALRAKGYNVVLTRSNDTYLSLGTRTAISNEVKPKLFTSIHYNSYNGSANGTEVYYNVKDKNGGLTKTAASNVLKRIVNTFGFSNRGIKAKANSSGTDYYYVLRENKYPSMLIECAFIDSSKDMNKLNSDSKITNLGNQIAAGIAESIK